MFDKVFSTLKFYTEESFFVAVSHAMLTALWLFCCNVMGQGTVAFIVIIQKKVLSKVLKGNGGLGFIKKIPLKVNFYLGHIYIFLIFM